MSVSRGGQSGDIITESFYRSEGGWNPKFDGSGDPAMRDNYLELDLPPGYVAELHEVEGNVYIATSDTGANATEYLNCFASVGTDSFEVEDQDFRLQGIPGYEVEEKTELGILDTDAGMALGPHTNPGNGEAHAGHPWNGHLEWNAGDAASGPISIDNGDEFGLDAFGVQRAQDGNGQPIFLQAAMTVSYDLQRM
jgi:hypothetical protein